VNALEFVLITTVATLCLSALLAVGAHTINNDRLFEFAGYVFFAATTVFVVWLTIVCTIVAYGSLTA
jgi:hypothetical protein